MKSKWYRLYIDRTFEHVTYSTDNMFQYMTVYNQDTNAIYRFTFLSPFLADYYHTHKIIQKTKRNQRINNPMAKFKRYTIPYLKNIVRDLVELRENIKFTRNILSKRAGYLKYNNIHFIDTIGIFVFAILNIQEIARYMEYIPSFPKITLYQYELDSKYRIMIGYLLNFINLYTEHEIVLDKQGIKELTYRDNVILNELTVQDILIINFYFFYYYFRYKRMIVGGELIDNNQGVRYYIHNDVILNIWAKYSREIGKVKNVIGGILKI